MNFRQDIFNVEKMKFIDNYFEYIDFECIQNNNNFIVIDLRTYVEYNFKNLKGSVHVSLMDDDKSLKLEGMFSNKTYFSTGFKSIFYILPELKRIRLEINKIQISNPNKTLVLACRHARVRSRCLAMYLNIFNKVKQVLVLRGGVNPILGVNKKDFFGK